MHVTTSAPDVNPFPIQTAKVQAPVLRDETLARDRLLDWLDAKIHHRLVLVIAEAGYGKTTLLADFTRRTRLRTIWYRLDETDQDWVTVLHHLVAAGRQTDPTFGSATWSLLGELGTGGSPMATILATFVRELQAIGNQGTVLILDDYHVVEGTPDLQQIVREIVTHAPERLSVVILSRRTPILPIARLRALGEVAEIGRDALRFEAMETERLFRETYGRPLEPDVLAELDRRTEGWAASLQLVRSALRERSTAETRTFIASLSGARGTLHDFLAEEVVGDLDSALQSFLMRTSILSTLSVETAAVAAAVSPEETRDHLESAAQIGLLPQPGDVGGQSYHPLVRDFLDDRLRREVGAAGVADLHRIVARFGELTDWKLAAHHYEAAGDIEDLHRVMIGSMQDIMGGGGFALAESYVRRYPDLEADPTFGLFLSRRDAYNGDYASALERAQAAVAAHPSTAGTHLSHLALANLATISMSAVSTGESVRIASELVALRPEPAIDVIARGTIALVGGSLEGNLEELERLLRGALALQPSSGREHYRGITLLNLANSSRARGHAQRALQEASQALELLAASSEGTEMATVLVIRGWALTHLGLLEEGRAQLAQARGVAGASLQEILAETGDVLTAYGDQLEADVLLESASTLPRADGAIDIVRLGRAEWHSRAGQGALAEQELLAINPYEQHTVLAFLGRWLLARSRAAMASGSNPMPMIGEAMRVLTAQRAEYWLRCAKVVQAVATSSPAELSRNVASSIGGESAYLTVCAAEVSGRLKDFDESLLELIREEVSRRPDAWRPILRRTMRESGSATALGAARLLDEFGEEVDIPALRLFARSHRSAASASLGRGLARLLAPKAHIEDLGHLLIQIGPRLVDGSAIRRKVLSLICFLITKPGFAATRDQVLEALWPELEPSIAVNSLNQTVYFLRRVFEPRFKEDESAEYVKHDGEIVRLDPSLVTSQSALCRNLADRARAGLDSDLVELLVTEYGARFAMDFEYEDWASPYRETLHAAYLDVVEQAVRVYFDIGDFERASRLARGAIAIDPEAEPIEAALLRLYRNTGSHAAASEQYSHYSAVDRAEGLDPRPLDEI
jgi:DNA-binding SARP family transcriptional activator